MNGLGAIMPRMDSLLLLADERPAGAGSGVDARPADVVGAAEQFEALLVRQMLDAARGEAAGDDEEAWDLEGDDVRTYQSLLAQELARSVAAHTRLGISEALVRQLDGAAGAVPGS